MYINIEGVFLMCEGYMGLTSLMANFCTNMAVEEKPRRQWLSTSCSKLAINDVSFFNVNFILYYIVLWTCQVVVVLTLQTLFVIFVACLNLKHINETLRASLEKCTTPILVWSWEINISHRLHTRYILFV
jgi:hypothetical protein